MINEVEIRKCDDNGEYYMVLGNSVMQKGAYRVLWECGLRSHDFKEDIIKDKLIKKINVEIGRDKNRWNRLINIIKSFKCF